MSSKSHRRPRVSPPSHVARRCGDTAAAVYCTIYESRLAPSRVDEASVASALALLPSTVEKIIVVLAAAGFVETWDGNLRISDEWLAQGEEAVLAAATAAGLPSSWVHVYWDARRDRWPCGGASATGVARRCGASAMVLYTRLAAAAEDWNHELPRTMSLSLPELEHQDASTKDALMALEHGGLIRVRRDGVVELAPLQFVEWLWERVEAISEGSESLDALQADHEHFAASRGERALWKSATSMFLSGVGEKGKRRGQVHFKGIRLRTEERP